jgi:hypothetical protein
LAECKADSSWRTFENTASGHDVMVDAPEWLTGILLQVVALARARRWSISWNTRLVRRDAGARYHGVTHEYIDVPGPLAHREGASLSGAAGAHHCRLCRRRRQ